MLYPFESGQGLEHVSQEAGNSMGMPILYTQNSVGSSFRRCEGHRLAAGLGEKGKGLILRNHGLLTVGSTLITEGVGSRREKIRRNGQT